MLPAAPAWSFIYREFLAELRTHFRCIALDFPGSGLSPDSDRTWSLQELSQLVHDFILQLDLREVTLLLHDSSGSIGIGAAGRLPERIRGLIVADTFAWPLRRDFLKIRLMLNLVTRPPVAWLQSRWNLIPRAAILTATGRKATREERSAFLAAFGTARRRERVLEVFRGLLQENAWLEQVEMSLQSTLADKPALVLFGEKDPARKAGFEQRWQELLHNATFELLPNQMHFPHFGAAPTMCNRIQSWHQRLSDSRAGSGNKEGANTGTGGA
jgi:haloalkane dehalogenase